MEVGAWRAGRDWGVGWVIFAGVLVWGVGWVIFEVEAEVEEVGRWEEDSMARAAAVKAASSKGSSSMVEEEVPVWGSYRTPYLRCACSAVGPSRSCTYDWSASGAPIDADTRAEAPACLFSSFRSPYCSAHDGDVASLACQSNARDGNYRKRTAPNCHSVIR